MNTETDIVQQLQVAKKDIEQFIDELHLEGTAAEERLETLKEELRIVVGKMKESLDHKDIISEEVATTLRDRLSALEAQLEKPKSNAINDIQLFLNSIKNTLKGISAVLADKEKSVAEILEKIHDQLQHYKLKLEIIRLNLAMKKLEMKYVSKEVQLQFTQKINAISEFLRTSKHGASEKLKKFRGLVNTVYTDLSKIYS